MAALFDWDPTKNEENKRKHGVPFTLAQLAFLDPRRVIADDIGHSEGERRFYCFGKVADRVMTVRFTMRKGRKIYEEIQRIHG